MSQVSPGDDGTRQSPGSQARKGSPPKGTPAKRPPAKAAPKGRPPTGAAKGGPSTAGKGRPPTAGGAKGRAPKPNMRVTAPPPRRFSPSTLAFASIGIVVVIILVFVFAKVLGGSSTPSSKTSVLPPPVAASSQVLSEVTGVTPAEAATVGTGSGITPPSVLTGQPRLTSAGKPELLFIG